MRLLIADDHAAVREGIKHMLQPYADMTVAAEASSLAQILTALQRETFDLIVLDLSLGDARGGDLLDCIRKVGPTVPILVYTMHPEDAFAARLFQQGIAGYVTKDEEPKILIEAIRRVGSGRRYITPTLAEELARTAHLHDRPAHERLSERELAVLIMTAEGKSLKEIAGRLGGVSLKTVSTYRSRMLKKLGLRTNADAIRYALLNRLQSPR